MRLKATISYDGSAFDGFQKQKHTKNTIAQKIEERLKGLGIETKIVASGRTDKGVHATKQIIHFDTPSYWNDIKKLKLALNAKLSHIHIVKIENVDKTFHARYSAKKREYRYIFKTSTLSVFEQRYLSFYEDFDKNKLQEALKLFLGEHDFINYCKFNSAYKNTKRHIYKSFHYTHNGYHIITLQANGFLHSQVRMIVEDSIRVAQGKIPLKNIANKLDCGIITNKTLAPPNGLYLSKVFY